VAGIDKNVSYFCLGDQCPTGNFLCTKAIFVCMWLEEGDEAYWLIVEAVKKIVS